jgi:hypothetical protein
MSAYLAPALNILFLFGLVFAGKKIERAVHL